ncbi:MAG: hypothetical protein ACTHK7_03875 [Aureliella sp.]
MVWFQRVWLALLLAIAGGGPLPLWLHHMQCHCAGEAGSCHAGAQACSHGHAHHGHAAHSHAVHGQAVTSAKSKSVPQVRSAASDHERCAACYCLSQLSLSAAFRTVAFSTSRVLLRAPTPDQIPEFDLLAAYSSRAPPAL